MRKSWLAPGARSFVGSPPQDDSAMRCAGCRGRQPLRRRREEIQETDCHTSDFGHWFAMTGGNGGRFVNRPYEGGGAGHLIRHAAGGGRREDGLPGRQPLRRRRGTTPSVSAPRGGSAAATSLKEGGIGRAHRDAPLRRGGDDCVSPRPSVRTGAPPFRQGGQGGLPGDDTSSVIRRAVIRRVTPGSQGRRFGAQILYKAGRAWYTLQ